MRRAKPCFAALAAVITVVLPGALVDAYPLDGRETRGIRRVGPEASSGRLPSGAQLSSHEIKLNLLGAGRGWHLIGTPRDAQLQSALEAVFRDRDESYAFAIVDMTDPEEIRWAGLREDRVQFPGSVGKVLTMVGLFDALARAFPDPDDRVRVLRETVVTATDWAMGDDFHKVPLADPATGVNQYRPIRPGDRFTLAEWIDHMVSASANSAGATVWKEAMLLRRFGSTYPASEAVEERFFKETPKTELTRLSLEVIDDPLAAAGLDLDRLRQGTMWTKPAQSRIPGRSSVASPRELVRLLVCLEQGLLVDVWSSLEMKRFLYVTRKRYRYAYAPELAASAIYFKSGSFYRCAPEEGYECGKYRGNKTNQMNSIAIIESPAEPSPDQRRYVVALTSDVLRKNSAWDHARLGAAIDEIVRTRRATVVKEEGSARQVEDSGRSE